MSDPNPNPDPAPKPAPPADPPSPPPTPGDSTGVQIPKARFDEVNDRMKSAEAELERLRGAQKAADDERLANEKKFEELAVKRTAERDEWKGKAETAEARARDLDARLHRIADERVRALPEKLRARVPEADKAGADARLEKIEELEAVLAEVPTQPVPPGLGRAPKPAGGANPKQQVDEAVERALRSGGYGF
jgi:hypothetical protein